MLEELSKSIHTKSWFPTTTKTKGDALTSLSPITPQDLLDQLITLVLGLTDPAEHEVVTQFVTQFGLNPTYEDLKKIPLEKLAEVAADTWNFIRIRPAQTPKIRVYQWKPDFETPLAERVVINIINDDMPFLIDSLLELLQQLNLKSRRIIHPILTVKRNSKGQLLEILPSSSAQDSKVKNESLIHCEIVDPVSPETILEIEKRLQDILSHVRLATNDWQPMQDQTDLVIQEIQNHPSQISAPSLFKETLQFLEWIKEDHFTYLGYGLFDFTSPEGNILRHFKCQNALGILKDIDLQDLEVIFKGVRFDRQTRQYLFDPNPLIINKASLISLVHRSVALDVLLTKRFNDQGQLIGIHLFLGLFTSIAYDSSIRDIPLLRRKVDQILIHAGISPACYDGKSLIHILDSLPRDDLFQASIEELTQIGLSILSLQERQRVALFVRQDQFNRFLSCLVHVPRDRFDSELCERMGHILAQELQGRLSDYKAQYGSLATARIHYIVYYDKNPYGAEIDLAAVEQKLAVAARSWLDDLRLLLQETYDDYKSVHLYREFKDAFSKGYQERFQGNEILEDIKILKRLQNNPALEARLYETHHASISVLRLKVYQPTRAVPLSDILPILENLDLKIIKENSFNISLNQGKDIFWIHEFKLESQSPHPIYVSEVSDRFHEAFYAVHQKKVEDDGFNRLVLRAGLTIRQCLILRVYYRYLRQLSLPFSREYIEQTLLKYPDITYKIVELFEEKFDPSIGIENAPLRTRILENLEQVDSPDEDRILRRYLNLVIASLRTNFYQYQPGTDPKDYVSIKFDAQQIDEMPLPKPMFEIFVYSTNFEGIHLRGGKVARGGIRWSDRFEDFRTEILGLVKAQMVKNTVIVPVGSKGGFVVRSQLVNPIRDEVIAEGIACYQNFIRGLLDITDNLSGGKPLRPFRTVCWDLPDPYLVVAADKGTATFSDYANQVSREYKFWLDDAFASGGSAGYDHKKMAITARGAWESVKRHFLELGHDIQTTPFRVVGVGDMSGDVFGNGMLLSRQIKLVAAFNHQHIFIDPQPDPETSFLERERLFQLPRSTWKDYNPDLISAGGGVFERRAKIIRLTPEMQQMLGVKLLDMTPVELIRQLLTLPTDLLWFGGIGTFVKSSKESHLEAGDRSNDNLRVNGKDLQCHVIGEGANLGMTQLGRIEFAQKGGRLNTDAIDNSAGVDCSDHEVNLKILFNSLIINKDITIEERNTTLAHMTDEIAQLILKNNYAQTQALSLMEAQGIKLLDEQINLIRHLEGKGRLNRAIEFLPDDGMFVEMQTAQRPLTRPELAVLMAYAKIDYYDDILESSLLRDFSLEEDLISYFPKKIQDNFKDNIFTHPLKKEIIATLLTNNVVNRLGPSYLYDVTSKLGCKIEDGFRAYLIVEKAFDLKYLWNEIEELDDRVHPINLLKIMVDILAIVRRIMPWLLRHYDVKEGILSISNVLKVGSETFLANLQECLDPQTKKVLEESIAAYENLLIGADLSQRIAVLQIAASSPDIILIASRIQSPIIHVARIYFEVGVRFNLALLRRRIDEMKTGSMWQRLALGGIIEDLYGLQSDLVEHILRLTQKENLQFEDAILIWCSEREERIQRIDQLSHEVLSLSILDLAAVSVLVREYRNL